jgi:hypothetical protein
MIQKFVALATALSVLWHASVGCCAHHDHAVAVRRPSVGADHESGVVRVSSCCDHQHAGSALFNGQQDSSSPGCVQDGDRPLPSDPLRDCPTHECTFANDALTSPHLAKKDSGTGSFPSGVCIAPCVAAFQSTRGSHHLADPPPTGLRRHLLLSVLTL